MKTMLKHKLIVALAMVAAIFASTSCEDNDTSYTALPNAKITSLEAIKKDPDLASFLAVVKGCGEARLDSLLNQPRQYTIWAPVNEAIDLETLMARISNGEQESVFEEFVKFHISNHLHPANGTLKEEDKNLLMLNDKYVPFEGNAKEGYKFGGCELIETNILTKNGIIHKINSTAGYRSNIWQALKSINSISSFWDFCNSFTVKEIDHANSIPGDIIDQEQTYLDTVYFEKNEMKNFGNLGPIDNEDSTYIVYAPTNQVWEKITAEAPNYFNFDTEELDEIQKAEFDSIKQVRGAKAYLRYLTYSMTEQKFADGIDFDNLPDSLIAMNGSYLNRKKVSTADLAYVDLKETSNGQLRVIDHMPFTPLELWHDTLRIEAENTYSVRKNVSGFYEQANILNSKYFSDKDQNVKYEGEISGNGYMIGENKDNILASRTFFVKNVLSAKYKIAVITVPEDILTKGDGYTNINQSSLSVSVKQKGEYLGQFPDPNDKANVVNISGGIAFKPAVAIRPQKEAIDTIFLADPTTGEPKIFDFKYCEEFGGISTKDMSGDENYTVEITVGAAYVAKRNLLGKWAADASVDPIIRVDAILLIPVSEEEEGSENDTEIETE